MDRLGKIGDGAVIVAFVCVSVAPTSEGESAVKSADRLAIISDGSVGIAFVCISFAPTSEGESACRIEPDRFVVIRDSLKIIARAGIVLPWLIRAE